jgi:RNA recognition motif-containing protein
MSGRDLRVDFSAGAKGQSIAEPSEKLYFSGCAGDEAEVRNIFKQFSNSIVDIHLLKDPQTGMRIRTGFVTMNSMETAKEAMEALHGSETPYGESLLVSYARARRFQPHGFSDQGSRRGSSGSFGNRSRGSSSSRSRWD